MLAVHKDLPFTLSCGAAAYDTLLSEVQKLGVADTGRKAAIGYCAGGGYALEQARAGADFKALVVFHVTNPNPVVAGTPCNIKGRVLAIHGRVDPVTPKPMMDALEEELSKAKVDWQVMMFGPPAVHSFCDPTAKGPATQYDEKLCRKSYLLMRDFFAETLVRIFGQGRGSPVRRHVDALSMSMLSRRSLIGSTAGSAAAALAASASPAAAGAPLSGQAGPGIYRYRIGDFELTALYDGIWYRPITDKFIRNAPFAEVEHALDQAFMPHDKLATPFTTLIVNTGKKLVLIDTGTGGQISPTAGAVVQQSGRRRHRAKGRRPDRDLAFSSRSHQRHQGQGQQSDLPQCRDHGAGAGMGVLDGRSQHERGARRPEGDVPQSAADFLRHRQKHHPFRTGQGSGARHPDTAGARPHAGPHGLRHSFRRRIR